ncbi:MAG: asparagine synthase (glutamine-hydrolyzing) [Pseudomonadales bacterium]|nr:asparagine synthase (glutamine-hydrolyzing) [Gammaproteobacteria bacterium]MBP6050392.1 asparagine synthase (glutamine-hydrolyzing) [Pseudomonadales bacterium]MBK6583689.1 asparagine synthase (glutamine-hydrolyzing) [Gammaproteobacteria bacterium]MBK7170293.1 asparagine synthase (glutamine-hydrolyzing) [Gammaproteobacteria bacterium]MBK8309266.1 asparagine synthase (glutamine-hydrolyzing) [Gammaproteobacteria bacterium]
MCGIAGLWRRGGPDPADGVRVERMAKTLIHRGPDDFGYLFANSQRMLASVSQATVNDFDPDVLIASRRLAIIDLGSQGRQPIANETSDVFVAFNGAIHNYVELREELESRGHTFRSHTDTEVIVHAYEEWGENCARRFNGMWAYAIWDARKRRLVCSRDRLGIKPLFVAWHGDTFYFASEVKAILAAGELVATPNRSFVHRYLVLDECENGHDTAFAGITQLSSGHNLVVTREGHHETRYWSHVDQTGHYDYKQPGETFRELFRDAVRIRLRSDVPVALLLSGGLDSSSIAVHAKAQEQAIDIEAYTAVFPGYEFDESRYAALVAKHVGMPLHCVEYKSSGLLEDMAAVTEHLDAPPRRGQELVRWKLLQAVSAQARVVLEGQGADEMLAGYPDRYTKSYLCSELRMLRPWNLHHRVPRMISARQHLDRMHSYPAPMPPIPGRILGDQILKDTSNSMIPVQFKDPLTRTLFKDHALGLLPELLHFGDAISMGHSLESRLPFLDHRLVEFVFKLPFDDKMRGAETKHVLRRAFARDLPEDILSRRDKVGFATPLKHWLQLHRSELFDVLNSQRTREREIFNPAGLTHCMSNYRVDNRAATRLFRCVALELWFRRYID